jgi:hypothetical protein
MKYQKNDVVILEDLKTTKIIADSEIISGIRLYYMSDKTSYSEKGIMMTVDELESLKVLCKENFFKIFDRDKLISNISDSLTKFYTQKKRLVTKSD